MNEQPDDQREIEPAVVKRAEPKQDWARQTMGAVIGGAAGLLLAMGLRALGWGAENVIPYILWGGVLGAMVSGIESLEDAGRRLTRRDARWLNIGVAVLGMVVILAVIFGLVSGLSLLLRQF